MSSQNKIVISKQLDSNPRQSTGRTFLGDQKKEIEKMNAILRNEPKIKKRKTEDVDNEILVEEICPVQVMIRCRGHYEFELPDARPACVMIPEGTSNELQYKEGSIDRFEWKNYTFDRVFGPTESQNNVYAEAVFPLLDEVLDGFNCTIFAYGQTGTGKTHTMEGKIDDFGIIPAGNCGVIPRAIHDLFQKLSTWNEKSMYIVKLSMLEIYNEEVYDLLASNDNGGLTKLSLITDTDRNLVIKGLEERIINSPEEGIKYVKQGSNARHTASTKLNMSSSRSHCILSLSITSQDESETGDGLVRTSKLNLVDLAGSEDISRSGAERQQAAEAGKINRSLLTLGKVIKQLYENSVSNSNTKPNYRESKLTRILEDSLGGRTKTCIIATISLAEDDMKETINTLKYASQAKAIKNKVRANVSRDNVALFKAYRSENIRIKVENELHRQKTGFRMELEEYKELVESLEKHKETTLTLENSHKILEGQYKDTLKSLTEKNKVICDLQNEINVLKTDNYNKDKLIEELKKDIDNLRKESKAHSENSDKLSSIADVLLNVTTIKSDQLAALHTTISSKQDIEEANMAFVNKLEERFVSKSTSLNASLSETISQMNRHSKELATSISSNNTALEQNLGTISSFINESSQTLINEIKKFENNSQKSHLDKTNSLSKVSQAFDSIFKFFKECNDFKSQLNQEFMNQLDNSNQLNTQQLISLSNGYKIELESIKEKNEAKIKNLNIYYNQREMEIQKIHKEEVDKLNKDCLEIKAEYNKLIESLGVSNKDFLAKLTGAITEAFNVQMTTQLNAIKGFNDQNIARIETFNSSFDKLSQQHQNTVKESLKDSCESIEAHNNTLGIGVTRFEESLSISDKYTKEREEIMKGHVLKFSGYLDQSNKELSSQAASFNSQKESHNILLQQDNQNNIKFAKGLVDTSQSLHGKYVSQVSHFTQICKSKSDQIEQLTNQQVNDITIPKLNDCLKHNDEAKQIIETFVNNQFKVESTKASDFIINQEEYPKSWDLIDAKNISSDEENTNINMNVSEVNTSANTSNETIIGNQDIQSSNESIIQESKIDTKQASMEKLKLGNQRAANKGLNGSGSRTNTNARFSGINRTQSTLMPSRGSNVINSRFGSNNISNTNRNRPYPAQGQRSINRGSKDSTGKRL